MSQRGVFVRAEEVRSLEETGRWRKQCCEVPTRAKPQGPLYRVVEQVMDVVDAVAEVVSGGRKRFHQVSPRTPGPDLPSARRRTME
ncbi:hypothetical protein ACRAWG_15735 [Methylobacterium sp. P31]